jgi:hypothetical protein
LHFPARFLIGDAIFCGYKPRIFQSVNQSDHIHVIQVDAKTDNGTGLEQVDYIGVGGGHGLAPVRIAAAIRCVAMLKPSWVAPLS